MSWRKAADLARQLAQAARQEADDTGIDESRLAAFRDHLRAFPDQLALVEWTRRRKAQHLLEFADECDRQRHTDITVVERGPKR